VQIEHFDESLFLVARLVENAAHDDAIVVLRPLIECELNYFHKTIVCINMAIVFGLKGEDSDALAWYERGVNYERPHGGYLAAEHKAAFMAGRGWTADSLALYEQLLSEPSLTKEDEERIRQNITSLKERPVQS
jgi:hypothetical protein